MLNVKKVLTKLLKTPMVVDQGTSGVWTYRKWSDGTSEVWCKGAAYSLGINTAWGSDYYGDLITVNFPSGSFNATPMAMITSHGGDGVYFAISTISSTSLKYYPFCAKNGTKAFEPRIYAIGKWK